MSNYAYSRTGGSFPKPLSAEEERRCIQQLETGETPEERKAAQDALIERNLRLVAHIVKKYHHKDCEDLISVGTVGLMKAILSFQSAKNVKLATYAARCIENGIITWRIRAGGMRVPFPRRLRPV